MAGFEGRGGPVDGVDGKSAPLIKEQTWSDQSRITNNTGRRIEGGMGPG